MPDDVISKVFEAMPEARAHEQGMRIGWLVDWQEDGQPRVDFTGNTRGPRLARTTQVVVIDDLRRLEHPELLIALVESEPVILAILSPVGAVAEIRTDPSEPPILRVDGERVVIEGRDEIVLQCGQASLVMRRNGRIVLRGTYVETRSKGVNRIKGGSVQIN